MSDDLDNDILNGLEDYDWEINNFEDLTQSDCDHNCLPTPDLEIKFKIDKVDLTKKEETHNKPEPSTSQASTSLRQTSQVRTPNCYKTHTTKRLTKETTQKSIQKGLTPISTSTQTTTPTAATQTITWRPATTLVPPIKTTHPLTNPAFTTAPNKLRPKLDCQVRIGNKVLHMITLPGCNPITSTHTDVDETFGTDLSQNLFLDQKRPQSSFSNYSMGKN
jgi:hypothetical protein